MSEETNRLRDRPDAPDPRVLADAARSLADLGGGGDSDAITWDIQSRIERPQSTLFQVRAHSSQGGAVDAYYKVSKPPPYEGERRTRWESTVRSGLTRALVLEQRLAGLFEGEGLAFSRALAVEPDSLTVVTLAVPGTAMGKVWRHLLPGRSRVDAIEILRRAGRAAWLIEECTIEPMEVDLSLASVIQRRLARVRDVVPPTTLQGIERLMSELAEEMTKSPRPMVYSHGDFSSSNLLIDYGLVGLIDFTWPLRQRGFDLAHFAFRLEYDTAVPASFTARVRQALISGYGRPGVVDEPGYRFVRLSKLLKVVEGGKGPLGKLVGRKERACAELQSYLED